MTSVVKPVIHNFGVLFDIVTLVSMRQHVYSLLQIGIKCVAFVHWQLTGCCTFRCKLQTSFILLILYISIDCEIHHLSTSRRHDVNQLQVQLLSNCQLSVAMQSTVFLPLKSLKMSVH